ncbi:hypothetical protein BU25DRAFT_351535, partial [Macroventuria anomochaeta]
SAAMAPNDFPTDSELLVILTTVGGIISLQVLVVITCLIYRNYKDKAKWRRLRQQGIVVVNGPALYWTDDQPLPPVPIDTNMVQAQQASRESRHVHNT